LDTHAQAGVASTPDPDIQGDIMNDAATPVVFIHGLWLHATSWGPWLDLFREAGYEPTAPGWPNEPDTVAAAREKPELVANTSID
jgi:pimeloyl-ACP methyl ester carboxylesterase